MLTEDQVVAARSRALEFFRRAAIAVTDDEAARIEVADFGLGDLVTTGLEILTYVNTSRCCAKELVLFPRQTCPEHRHPPLSPANPGKEETFRCRWGRVYLYLPGAPSKAPRAVVPAGGESAYTVFHEVTLLPGEQYTLPPDTLHWFQAGDDGAVISEFSTTSTDEADAFTDTRIVRVTMLKDQSS